jgi:heat shock protein HslJ
MRVRRTPALLLAVAASAVLLTSCGSSSGSEGTASPSAVTTTGAAAADLPAPSAAQVVGTWSVFVLPAKPGASEQKVTFTETELSTSDGCNTATAGYTLGADGAFKVGEVAQTQKACTTAADTRHIEALQAATRVGLDTRSGFDQLVFTDAQGGLVLVLQRDETAPGGS